MAWNEVLEGSRVWEFAVVRLLHINSVWLIFGGASVGLLRLLG